MKGFLLSVMFAFGLTLPGSPAFAQSAEDWYQRGFEHSLQGKTQSAIQAYRKALDRWPDWAEARHALATLLYRTGQGPQAIAQFRLAEQYYARRTDAPAMTNLAIVRRNLQQAYRELGLQPEDFEQIESIAGLPTGPQWQFTGSGFLAGRTGTVLTALHAVQGAKQIRVRLADRSVVPARLLRSFIVYDVAVLELQTSEPLSYGPLVLGDSSALNPGDPVFSLTPSGANSPSPDSKQGRLLARNALESNRVIYHVGLPTLEADSGGPLFNQNGEVVGMLLTRQDIQKIFRRMKPVPANTGFAIKSSYLQQTLTRVGRQGAATSRSSNESSALKSDRLLQGRVGIEVTR